MYSVMLLSEGRDPANNPEEEIKPEVSPFVPVPRFPDPRDPEPRFPDPNAPEPSAPGPREADPKVADPKVAAPKVPDPRDPVASEPEPRLILEGVALERLPSEGVWRLLWDWRGEDCWRREEQDELAALKDRERGAPLERGLKPPPREWVLLKWGFVVTGAISLVSGGRVPIAVFRSCVNTMSSGFLQNRYTSLCPGMCLIMFFS